MESLEPLRLEAASRRGPSGSTEFDKPAARSLHVVEAGPIIAAMAIASLLAGRQILVTKEGCDRTGYHGK